MKWCREMLRPQVEVALHGPETDSYTLCSNCADGADLFLGRKCSVENRTIELSKCLDFISGTNVSKAL